MINQQCAYCVLCKEPTADQLFTVVFLSFRPKFAFVIKIFSVFIVLVNEYMCALPGLEKVLWILLIFFHVPAPFVVLMLITAFFAYGSWFYHQCKRDNTNSICIGHVLSYWYLVELRVRKFAFKKFCFWVRFSDLILKILNGTWMCCLQALYVCHI